MPTQPTGRDAALRAGFTALQEGAFQPAFDAVAPHLRDDDAEITLIAGLALGGLGRAAEAAPRLVLVAVLRPDALHPCVDLLSLLSRRFRARDAAPTIDACLALTPDDPRLLLCQAQFLTDVRDWEGAMAAVEHSLALRPGSLPALNQKAIILVGAGRIEEALGLFRHVVATDPTDAPGWTNLGCALTAEGAFEESLSAYRRAIALRPRDAQIRLNHSIALLKAGRMAQGWQEHEWRLRLPGHTELPNDRLLPTLGPDSDLSGRSVLLTHEEGIGDTLMMLRYVPALARLGAKVIAWVPASLVRTVARVEGIAGVMATDSVELTCDHHCPFISLPRAFALRQEAWGAPAPYLQADAAATQAHRDGLPAGLRVGLVWGGAPRAENLAANAIDARRSIGLERLASLADIPGLVLVSLQVGPYADALRDPPPGLAIIDPMRPDMSMDDTASLVAALDVVVSVDTAVVHLAGGLGVPTILLDRYDNCWRWFHGRTDSPWYPSVEIIRQRRPGDWGPVVGQLCERLRGLARC